MGALVLALSLNGIELAASEGASWEDFLHKFDFVGLLLFIGSTSCIIVGLSLASSRGCEHQHLYLLAETKCADPGTAPLTLILITMGPSLLISAGVYELWTTRNALFPRAIFNNVNIIILLIVSFLQNVAFNSGTFYLTLYYQTVNVPISTLHAGVMLLPYSLGSSLASIPATWLIGAIQRRTHNTVGQKWVISSGLLIATTGFALLCLLGEHTRTIMQSFLPLLGGFGLGMLNHAPYQSLTSALPPKELAAGTGAFFLVRFTGATVGLSVAGAIYQSKMSHTTLRGASLASYSASTNLNQVPITIDAFRNVWTMCAPSLASALLLSLFLRPTPLFSASTPPSSDTSQSDANR